MFLIQMMFIAILDTIPTKGFIEFAEDESTISMGDPSLWLLKVWESFVLKAYW